jgi:hypothetical protein
MIKQDFRARLQPKAVAENRGATATTVLGPRDPSNILFPLYQTGGVLFPYTPTVVSGAVVEYDQTPFTHTIYGYNAYRRSYPKTINVTGEFTAQSNDEALYMLAVIHFFRSVTKSYFGVTPYNRAGVPPPTLLFNYLGEYQFNNVPVIVKTFDYTYPANVDYVPVDTSDASRYFANIGVSLSRGNRDGISWVPTHLTVAVELDTQYVPITLRNEFNLDEFRRGGLMGRGYI